MLQRSSDRRCRFALTGFGNRQQTDAAAGTVRSVRACVLKQLENSTNGSGGA